MNTVTSKRRQSVAAASRHDLAIYDGRELLGHVREEGGRCRATTSDGRELGDFLNRKAAANAISEAHDARRLDWHQRAASFDYELEDIFDLPRGGAA